MGKKEIDQILHAPVVKETDVLIVGGGSAGWSAAIAAARCGVKVILVERNYELGGTSTTAMMHLFGAPSGEAHGLMKEVLDRLSAEHAAILGELTPYDGQQYAQLIFRMLEEAGVEILLGTVFSSTIVEDNQVKGIIIETKTGPQAIWGQVVIDATGDGDVCANAGASFVLGREIDHKMRPITMLFRIGNIDVVKLLNWVKAHPEEFKQDENSHIIDDTKGLYRLHGFFGIAERGRAEGKLDKECHYIRFEYVWPERNIALINSTRVYSVNALDPFELSSAIVTARKQIDLLYHFIRTHIPGCENTYIVDVSSMPGIRETRHIIGDYILTEEDLANETVFEDRLFRDYRRVVPGAAVHSPDGNEGAVGDNLEREQKRRLYTFTIPYRCFLPKGLQGVLVAGRCFSATHQADGWTRDTPGCILMGQAAGTAAALGVKNKVSLRKLNPCTIRLELNHQGVITD